MSEMDPVTMAVIANRLDSMVREMSNTLLRAGRSTVLTIARDFSCAVVTGEHDLLATAEGLPVHVCGAALQAEAMAANHPDLAPGDAFLHNDPYSGNTHAADHTILVPVFVGGEHLFTACAKAHQADAGNAAATTYSPFARDVYEEGALIFPAVRVQRDGEDIADVINICRSRIRVPDQWFGDYLAAVGAARIGERRLIELTERYGVDTIRLFIREWFDYSARRTEAAIAELEPARFEGSSCHDPIPGVLPDGIPITAQVEVIPERGRVVVDLRANGDCVPAGLNLSKACAINHAMSGVFNCLDPSIPHNAGTFRCVEVLLRENCVAGIPRFPASCSLATTDVGLRVISAVQTAFAAVYPDRAPAEGAGGLHPGIGVISGKDSRHGGAPFINEIFLGSSGGPGTPTTDGWLTFTDPAAAGLLYRDSVEVDELRYPIVVREIRITPDSGGAGKFRGGPAAATVFGPAGDDPLHVLYTLDYRENPAIGVRGGKPAPPSSVTVIDPDGSEAAAPSVGEVILGPGQAVHSSHAGGGGWGDPFERDPERVLADVRARWVSPGEAEAVYGVAVVGEGAKATIDLARTEDLRRPPAP